MKEERGKENNSREGERQSDIETESRNQRERGSKRAGEGKEIEHKGQRGKVRDKDIVRENGK